MWVRDQPDGNVPTGELVKRALEEEDPTAWESLIGRYVRRVRAVVRSYGLSTHDAQDAEQTVWFRLSDHLARIRSPDRIGAWLASTAHDECRRQVRLSRRVTPADPTQLDAVDHHSPETLHLDAEAARRVHGAITQLSEPDRTVAALDLNAPRSPASDVAEFTGLPRREVPTVRRRARRRLRRILTSNDQRKGSGYVR